jgi:hypothetical protein
LALILWPSGITAPALGIDSLGDGMHCLAFGIHSLAPGMHCPVRGIDAAAPGMLSSAPGRPALAPGLHGVALGMHSPALGIDSPWSSGGSPKSSGGSPKSSGGSPKSSGGLPRRLGSVPGGVTCIGRGALAGGTLLGWPFTSREHVGEDLDGKEPRIVATSNGFDVHCAVRIAAGDDEGRERLLRYCAHPPFALERIEQMKDGRIAYAMRTQSVNSPC